MKPTPAPQDSTQIELPKSTSNESKNDLKSNVVEAPSISIPKGGGAIAGIGEKFQANPVTGTGSMSVPIALSPGRSGFTPQLSLAYDSGSGNGTFGMGWNMAVPAITRKTQKGLPQYQDEEESDIFILSGAEDLVPLLEKEESTENWLPKLKTQGDYTIKYYRPRTEGLFAKIEKHTHQTSGIMHWEVTTKDNITSVYGSSSNSRIFDSKDEKKIFQWMLEYTYDEKGNVTRYEYKQENDDNVNSELLNERNRSDAYNQKYLKSVCYTPNIPYNPADSTYFDTVKWHFRLVLDYGEHDVATPSLTEVNSWSIRQDIISSFRSGFEVRTYRLCHRVLLFHHFENDLGAEPYLVKSTDISYDENPVATRVSQIQHQCYQTGEVPQSYPPVSFQYSEATISSEILQYSVEDMENLPSGIDGSQYRWTDLHGEGIPGVLIEDPNAWYFKRNLGDENYYKDLSASETPEPEARLAPKQTLTQHPSLATLGNGASQISDIDGNGTQDLVIKTPEIQGYYAQDIRGQWSNFKAFESHPNINWNDPNLRVMDIDGDGFADLIMTEENCFTCYPSLAEKGYGPSFKTEKKFEEEEGPNIIFADLDQSVYLADMSGDGLSDIVRVRNGSVCYWSNQGHGKFGKKIALDNSPWLDHTDIFDQKRVRLADIDGSGTADLLYIANDGVKYFPNHSGNAFGDEVMINQQLPTHDLATISTLDILGNGTQCLVWSSPVAGDHPPALKYIDLMGGQKPYLLTEVNNNMGSITRLKYAPSTKFYLRDERAGTPWITKLPFPVQVVERVELWDEINRNRFVTKYAYHHGYFDGVEREFRGFGMVEQWDTESFTDFIDEGLFPSGYNASEEILHVAPIYTKTWFHTGFYDQSSDILGQYEKEYWSGDIDAFEREQTPLAQLTENNPELFTTAFDDGRALREATRALKGSALRQEVYSRDGSTEAGYPYTVTENSYEIRLVQPRGSQQRDRDYASFINIPAETLTYQYERNPSDPRIGQQLTLDVDAYGQPVKIATVAYPRRNALEYAQQGTGHITIQENTLINEADNTNFYRLGVPSESKSYELLGVTHAEATPNLRSVLLTQFDTANEIAFEASISTGIEKRLLDHAIVYYYDEVLSTDTPLALGVVASHALPYENYQLALTAGLISDVLNEDIARVNSVLLDEGAYIDLLGDDNYWIPSGKTTFDTTRFYLPINQTDPFGNVAQITYDSYQLLPFSTIDALSNTTTAQYDYRVLQPDLVTDPNGNRQAFAFDVRGMVTKSAVMGKDGSTDGDTLDDPSATFDYDLFRWVNEQKPNLTHSQIRETHQDTSTRYQEAYAYSNGLGQTIMTKTKAAPGEAFARDAEGNLMRDGDGAITLATSDPRWIGSGRTILDNKGNPIKQYEPYFSSTHEYESEAELVEYGVSPVIHYDPLGRAIRTELPDDTLTRVVFTPWYQENYDQNDTVIESLWYTARNSPDPSGTEPLDSEERAAWLAAKHGNTPQVVHLDSLGRPFVTIDHNKKADDTDEFITMITALDIKGNPLNITDAKGRIAFTYTYDVFNQPTKTTHIDNGTRYAISNVVGNPLKAWDSRDQVFQFKYDELQRPTHQYVSTNGATPSLISLQVYGESLLTPEANNLRGQAYLSFDSAGITQNIAFDFKGNLLHTKRQLALNYQTSPDWISLDDMVDISTILTTATSLLSPTVYQESMSYDALNRPTSMIKPDASEVLPSYNEAGQLLAIDSKLKGAATVTNFVQGITYNARGQRSKINYGNHTQTSYSYNALTFRLTRLKTTRDSDTVNALQDLNYTFDPVGNIVEQVDLAHQSHFYNNTEVNPNGKYIYDALYRLLQSEGRELIGLNTAPNELDTTSNILTDDTTAMRQYTQSYEYDELGNIEKMIHAATGGSWTRHYHYDHASAPTNNYLLSTSSDGTQPTSDDYTYDAHGNMTTMPHLSAISWDYADRMQSSNLGGGGTAYYTYDAAGDRVRKVIERQEGIIEERIYLGDWEVYKKTTADGVTIDTERETLHISDDTGRIALVDTLTSETTPKVTIRYQLSNHLGSASLELDDTAAIISYEEYHPFGTTAYRSGRNAAEVSLKRYRYVGKERDEETGLYYYDARYYAPWIGRFTAVDNLIDDYPHITSYNYADNNPITDLDIDGQQTRNTQKRFGGVPDKPAIPNLPANKLDFAQNVRPDLLQNYKQASGSEKSAASNKIDNAFTDHKEQVRNDFRSQLKSDFFIDKIDGKYQFDTKAAVNAFKNTGQTSEVDVDILRGIAGSAREILADTSFDSFAFESQGAKAAAAKQAADAKYEAQQAQAALEREIKKLLTPGPIGQTGDAISNIGDAYEITGYFLIEIPVVGEALIITGKTAALTGGVLQSIDDFQRFDNETALKLGLIRLSAVGLGELGGKGAKYALEKEVINYLERAGTEIGIKNTTKLAEEKAMNNVTETQKQQIIDSHRKTN